MMLPDFHVMVQFGPKITPDMQGKAMLALEKHLRWLGVPAEVFKDTMGDDSKLRRMMTPEERAKL